MRLSTSLVTVCATTLALVTPLAAADDSSAQDPTKESSQALGSSLDVGHTSTKDLSPECADEVNQARKDHEAAVADGTAGSSFMGPQELANGVLNGYGSSGMPEEP